MLEKQILYSSQNKWLGRVQKKIATIFTMPATKNVFRFLIFSKDDQFHNSSVLPLINNKSFY